MIKTQVPLPNELCETAKEIAAQHERLPTELIHRGVEHTSVASPDTEGNTKWNLPVLTAQHFVNNFDDLDFKAMSEQIGPEADKF